MLFSGYKNRVGLHNFLQIKVKNVMLDQTESRIVRAILLICAFENHQKDIW